MADNLSNVSAVEIDPEGVFKYILVRVKAKGGAGEYKDIVRGTKSAEFHNHIFEKINPNLEKLGLECNCLGGGKESESAYSGRLSMVADLLQALFKEAYSLQKVLMELLDRISLEPAAAEEVVVMVTVIHSLLDICSVISNMDHALHANTWKCIIKQSIKHQSLLEEQLRHNDIVFSLCEDMLITFQSCMQLAEQMSQSGTQEFKSFVAQSCGRLHLLYLQIYSKFPPSAYASKLSDTHSGEINAVILVALDPLITQLLSLRPFVEEVLADRQQSSVELFLPQCLLLVTIMDKLPTLPDEVLGLWCQGSQFPHHVYVHLCAFIASVPRECFPPLNTALSAMLCVCRESCEVIEEKTLAFVMGLISQLWTCMSVKQVRNQPCVQCTLRVLLSLSAIFVQNLDPQTICEKIVAVENKDARVERLKSERSVLERLCVGLEPVSKEETGDLQPYRKRARQETPEEEEFEKVLHTAEHALKMLQSLLQQTPAPNWMAARLQGLATQIHSLNGCKLQGL
ncbi:UNVERIFIED_CONTAM: hypothetical protein FKN15_053814 [Acipenser sinensis]